MRSYGIDAYIITSSDPHQSEYVADHWSSRAWITGFDGSAGTAVVGMKDAGLWTDSRYFLQAEMQLADGPFTLQRLKVQTAPEYLDWIEKNLVEGQKVGFDGNLISLSQYREIEKRFKSAGLKIDHDIDLIDGIWADRPEIPLQPIFEHGLDKAVRHRVDKINKVRDHLIATESKYQLVSALDNIAWVLNIRGKDIVCNPVSIAYLIIGKSENYSFCRKSKNK